MVSEAMKADFSHSTLSTLASSVTSGAQRMLQTAQGSLKCLQRCAKASQSASHAGEKLAAKSQQFLGWHLRLPEQLRDAPEGSVGKPRLP